MMSLIFLYCLVQCSVLMDERLTSCARALYIYAKIKIYEHVDTCIGDAFAKLFLQTDVSDVENEAKYI